MLSIKKITSGPVISESRDCQTMSGHLGLLQELSYKFNVVFLRYKEFCDEI